MDLQPDAELLSLARPQRAISNFVSFLAMLVMIQLLLLLAYESFGPDAAAFPFYFQRQRMVNDPAVAKLWF